MKERLSFIDWAKSIAILCVCIGHFLPGGSTARIFLYTFHVPVFFVISGFLSHKTLYTFSWAYYAKLSIRVLIPYVVWFSGSVIPQILIYGDGVFSCFEKLFFLSGTTLWNSALWFLPCYYVVSCCHYLSTVLYAKNNSIRHLLMVIILLVITVVLDKLGIKNCFLGLNKCAFLLAIQHFGNVLRNVYEQKLRLVNSRWLWMLCFFISGAASCIVNYGNNLSIMNVDYNNIFLYIPLSLLMASSFVLLCIGLPQDKNIECISRNTIPIMCGHLFIRLVMSYVLKEGQALYILFGVCVAMLSCVHVVCICRNINRYSRVKNWLRLFGFQI